MLALHVEMLTDRYAASAYNDRSSPEWPPHPARVYSALVDALYSEDDPPEDECAALDALAAWDEPTVVASDGFARRVMTFFVPVNDVATTDRASLTSREEKYRHALRALRSLPTTATPKEQKSATGAVDKARKSLRAEAEKRAHFDGKYPKENPAAAVMPWSRTKQPRTFPAFLPHDSTVSVVWPEADVDDAFLGAMNRIASRVVRLGHSSSFVAVRATGVAGTWAAPDDEQRVVWKPDPRGDEVLRVPLPGQRRALDAAFARHGGDLPGRVMPARHVWYRQATEADQVGSTVRTGGRWIAYHLLSKELPPASAAVAVAGAVRDALLEHAGSPPASVLTGRDGDAVLQAPHLAILPLPFVGHRHADGAIHGFALSLPSDASQADDHALLAALGRWEAANDDDPVIELVYGDLRLTAERVVDTATSLKTLRRARWAKTRRGPARSWATATPIALDGECAPLNHPKASVRRKAHRTAAKLVRKAILYAVRPPKGRSLTAEHIDLTLVFDTPVPGGAHLGDVPTYRRPGHPRPRRLVHALFELPFPVRGPMILGSGRHFGLGLCVPLRPLEDAP